MFSKGCGFEPMYDTTGIANGTAYTTGHLITASVYHGGPGSRFFLTGYTHTSLAV